MNESFKRSFPSLKFRRNLAEVSTKADSSFLIRALFFAGLAHLLIFISITLTLPAPTATFRPNLVFLGSLFKSENLFDSILDRSPTAKGKDGLRGFEFNPPVPDTRRHFNLDKPRIEAKSGAVKKTMKSTFVLEKETQEPLEEEFPPAEDFSLKPLKLERP